MPVTSADSVANRTSYTPAAPRSSSGAPAIAECVTAILEGRPLPEQWRAPTPPPASAPRTIEEGIARILRGHAPR